MYKTRYFISITGQGAELRKAYTPEGAAQLIKAGFCEVVELEYDKILNFIKAYTD